MDNIHIHQKKLDSKFGYHHTEKSRPDKSSMEQKTSLAIGSAWERGQYPCYTFRHGRHMCILGDSSDADHYNKLHSVVGSIRIHRKNSDSKFGYHHTEKSRPDKPSMEQRTSLAIDLAWARGRYPYYMFHH